MKRPTQEEIQEEFSKIEPPINNAGTHLDAFKDGIDFVLKYNEEQRDVLKIYDIGYEINMHEILDILENENHLWDEYCPYEFEGITDVGDMGDHLQIYFNMRSDHRLHEGLQIDIDDKGRVQVQAGDTPWEGSGFESELEEAIMSYVVKQKYK